MIEIARGTPSKFRIGNENRILTPVVAADRPGEFSQFGVGYVGEDGTGSFWGLVMPHPVIRAWRAMKLLEHIPIISDDTLCACYYAVEEKPSDSDQRYVDRLAEQFADQPSYFKALRKEISRALPASEHLEQMLMLARDEDVEVSTYELAELVKRGLVPTMPVIDELIEKADARQREFTERRIFLEEKLPWEASLGALFEQLGITNLVDGPPLGHFGWDWGHAELDRLDSIVKDYTTGQYARPNGFFRLERTQNDGLATATAVAPGVTVFQTNLGDLGEVTYESAQGALFTFLGARFHDGSILVKTRIEQDSSLKEEILTVLALRQLIGPIRPPKSEVKPKRPWWAFWRHS